MGGLWQGAGFAEDGEGLMYYQRRRFKGFVEIRSFAYELKIQRKACQWSTWQLVVWLLEVTKEWHFNML